MPWPSARTNQALVSRATHPNLPAVFPAGIRRLTPTVRLNSIQGNSTGARAPPCGTSRAVRMSHTVSQPPTGPCVSLGIRNGGCPVACSQGSAHRTPPVILQPEQAHQQPGLLSCTGNCGAFGGAGTLVRPFPSLSGQCPLSAAGRPSPYTVTAGGLGHSVGRRIRAVERSPAQWGGHRTSRIQDQREGKC